MGGEVIRPGETLASPAGRRVAPGEVSSLGARLRRAERLRRWKAVALVAPLLVFLFVTFAIPIGGMLWRSVVDTEVAPILPRTLAALEDWDGRAPPGEAAFDALAADLRQAREDGTAIIAARRLNYDVNGYRTLLMSTARRLPDPGTPNIREAFLDIDPLWGQVETWGAIARARGPLTDFYLLAALDLGRDATGAIERSPPDRAIYLEVLIRTFRTSLIVTALCLALGFPVAHLLATRPPRVANLLMILVLLPFWTSLLVRTTAWIVLLQNEGLVNGALLALGVVDEPIRMIYNAIGVYVAMTHVLLPFMILPLYSTMKAIPPSYMRAAFSLGAAPATAFRRVYLPLCLPGIAAGCLLVFILAIGYYITPALVGGAGDQMISYFIAFYTTNTLNWGMAAALGAVLLTATLILYWVYSRLVGAGGMRMG